MDVRSEFPFLERTVQGKRLIYFDNAATTQKPRQTIEKVGSLYSHGVSNVHRAVNFLADEVTRAFECARETVARFINAHPHEIIFVSNTTQAINMVCSSLSRNDSLRVLTTTLEHHSNLIPWYEHGKVDFIDWSEAGILDLGSLQSKLRTKPNLVALTRASNFLGSLHPIREAIHIAHGAGVPVLVDASQSIAHEPHDVQDLNCDYLAFSGHKIYGPGGIGVLYVKGECIDRLKPVLVGGGMVKEVHADGYVPNDVPFRFEAGTPNIEGAIGLAAALEFVSSVGYETISSHEQQLIQHAKHEMSRVPGLCMLGPAIGTQCAPIISFHMKEIESSSIAKTLANRANVLVRSGFHCAQPAHERLQLNPTVRASFAVYNTREEIDEMMEVITSLSHTLN